MTNPSKWKNITLGELSSENRYGLTAKAQASGTHRFIRITDITDQGCLKLDDARFISPSSDEIEKYSLKAGDLLIARSGSVGRPFLAEEDLQAVFASYLIRFRPKVELILPEFLFLYCLSPYFQDFAETNGRGAAIHNINAKTLSSHYVPVPSIDEQRFIVIHIKECLKRIEEIRHLHQQNRKAIGSAKLSLVIGERRFDQDWVEVGKLVDWIKDTEPVSETETYDFVGAKSFGKGLFYSATRTTKDFKYQGLRRLRHRDFIYPKLMAWEGAFGMVPKEFDGFVVSPEFVVFRTKDGIICPEVLDTYFRSPICLEDVRNASTGSNKRRRRINPQAFLKLKMPVPPHDVQEQLKKVYEFEAKAAESWKDLPETLEKIRQGILKKAFAGEL